MQTNGKPVTHVFPDAWDTPFQPGAALLALVFALYFLGAKLGVLLTVMPEGIAIVWLPNCVVLAALIRFNGARYPAIAALAVAAEIAADWQQFTFIESLLFGIVNVAEATLAYVLLRRWRFDPRFSEPADLGKFVLAGPVAGAFAAALLGALIYSVFRGTDTVYLEFVRIWWFGDALGLLIFTPLLLGFRPFEAQAPSSPLVIKPVDVAVWAAAAITLGLFWISKNGQVLGMHFGPLLMLPFVFYAAARYPQRWAAVAIALAAIALVAAMTQGTSPFGELAPRDAVIRAQEFILIMSLVALGLATLLAQLRARHHELELVNDALRRSNDKFEARVVERTSDLRRANDQLAALASIDPLTELYNRRGLFDIAQREVALARRHARSLSLMLVDLDYFKTVNDRFGHLVGDETLKHCALVIKECARASDSCGRYGGEEFVVLAPETGIAGGIAFAERIHRALREKVMRWPRGSFNITASIGVTVLGQGDSSVSDVLHRADAALYRAKSAGRDRVICIPPQREIDSLASEEKSASK